MSKRKSPQSQIRGSVTNTSENEFNSFNYLMYKYFSKVKFSTMAMSSWFFNQCFLLFSLFGCSTVLAQKNQRLDKEHNWDHNQSSDEEVELNILLGFSVIEGFSFGGSHFQWHIDHNVDDSWRRMNRQVKRFPRSQPLVNDTETHVSEGNQHESQLGEELKDEIKGKAELDTIHSF